jgi:hypothetical protein
MFLDIIHRPVYISVSRGIAVGIATGYGLDDRAAGVRVLVRSEFSLLHIVQTGSGAHTASFQWVPGDLSPGVKRLGGETDHSPPASAEVKKIWMYTSIPPYAFMA